MAHVPEAVKVNVLIDLDVASARKRIKRVIAEAQEANRELARLDERLGTLGAKLAPFGIQLEAEE